MLLFHQFSHLRQKSTPAPLLVVTPLLYAFMKNILWLCKFIILPCKYYDCIIMFFRRHRYKFDANICLSLCFTCLLFVFRVIPRITIMILLCENHVKMWYFVAYNRLLLSYFFMSSLSHTHIIRADTSQTFTTGIV